MGLEDYLGDLGLPVPQSLEDETDADYRGRVGLSIADDGILVWADVYTQVEIEGLAAFRYSDKDLRELLAIPANAYEEYAQVNHLPETQTKAQSEFEPTGYRGPFYSHEQLLQWVKGFGKLAAAIFREVVLVYVYDPETEDYEERYYVDVDNSD